MSTVDLYDTRGMRQHDLSILVLGITYSLALDSNIDFATENRLLNNASIPSIMA